MVTGVTVGYFEGYLGYCWLLRVLLGLLWVIVGYFEIYLGLVLVTSKVILVNVRYFTS